MLSLKEVDASFEQGLMMLMRVLVTMDEYTLVNEDISEDVIYCHMKGVKMFFWGNGLSLCTGNFD
jgi:hypothetical protein